MQIYMQITFLLLLFVCLFNLKGEQCESSFPEDFIDFLFSFSNNNNNRELIECFRIGEGRGRGGSSGGIFCVYS